MRRWVFPCISTAAIVLVLGGCDSSTPHADSSLEETSVKGVIRVHGKPLEGGEIHFNPASIKRKVGGRDAPISKDGSYTVKTLVGQNIVTVSPPKKKGSKALYGLEYEEKTVQLQAGENTQDFDFLQ